MCSAVAGTTNLLEQAVDAVDRGRDPAPILDEIRAKHRSLGAALGLDVTALLGAALRSLAAELAGPGPVTPARHARILAHGELLSTRLGAHWLASRGLPAAWLDARDVLRAVDDDGPERAEHYLSARCAYAPSAEARARVEATRAPIVVTQGFVARDGDGDTVLLGRGGSDTSAAYFAALIDAERLEIWTDVPGLFTADPRVVRDARLLRQVSYAEAEALGALGAKVLHPRSIEPVREHRIPIRLGWTARPDVLGTRINGMRVPGGPKAISARRNLVMLSMRRPSTWQPIGFMAEVAACFGDHGLSMDLITTSPAEIRATVDLSAFPSAADTLGELTTELTRVCEPRVVTDVACVSLVGAGLADDMTLVRDALGPLAGAGVHMLATAANGSHVSAVVDEALVDDLVAAVHQRVFGARGDAIEGAVFGPLWSAMAEPPRRPPTTPPKSSTGEASPA